MEYLTKDELLKLLSVAKDASQRDFTMILIGFRFGLRATEICQIRLEDVQGNNFSVQRLKGSHKTIHPIPAHKGLPILNLQRALREWLAIRPRNSVFLFPSERNNKALTRKSFFRLFQQYAVDAGLPENKRHPHCLKHALCTLLARQGMDVAWIQSLVGHANIQSTMKYIQLSQGEVSAAAEEALTSIF